MFNWRRWQLAGLPLLLTFRDRGWGWVGRLAGLTWSQSPEGLSEVLQRLADQQAFRQQLCEQSRGRYLSFFAREAWLRHLQRSAIWWKGVWSAHMPSEGALSFEQHHFHSAKDRPPVLELVNVGLEIPVFTTETRSLKSTLIRSVTGGRLIRSRGGAVVTALQGIS